MNRLLLIVAVAAFGALGVFIWNSNRPAGLPGVDLGAVSAQEAGDVDTSMVAEMTLGNPDAPVTVVEYASFTCPHCGAFHANEFKRMKAEYIDTGKINFIYREVYFDRYGLWAGMLARCGGEERYFGIADLLYQNQREWLASGDPAGIAGELRRLGRTAGLEEEAITACLSDADMAQAMVAVYQENATADDVSSTPSFLINGEKVSGNNYPEVKRLIDAALGG
ncbi:DsbA family protein [Ovoidimarina sediminis]|uniref:DsbA family protein n=1 Tax=Ovoidimarina sediminis TaxID=3079856 RepID=UPI0029114344|nr:DsbA family protein [Rhodophyticola sp. MJ-SS7]MDU8942444.1 DsbA family protein [Rhodophyticola sp. MJ-SS7]